MNYKHFDVWPQAIHGHTFDEIFAQTVEAIHDDPPFVCSPRGQKVKEALAVTLILDDPRARLLNCRARDAQYGFGVGEFLWYWAGKRDLETMMYYNKRSKSFSDDGETLNSAYGWRIKKNEYNLLTSEQKITRTQWEVCKNTLLRDHDSRRALLLINDEWDQIKADVQGSKDVPCTLSLQFFIRDDELHMHAHMRSNDVMWGLTYDLFSFTLLQEMMMLELREAGLKRLQLGKYFHTAGSLHIYEHHFEMAEAVVKEYVSKGSNSGYAAPMAPFELREMARLLELEEALRTGKEPSFGSDSFVGGARWMAKQLEDHRRKRDQERERAV